jgi:predicted dehydrogenase
MSKPISRRQFAQNSAAVVGMVYLGTQGRAEAKSPNEKLNLGVIGTGGRGNANLNGVASENIVAICDVDDRTLNAGKQRFPTATTFNDFRKLIDAGGLDGVVISTTDFTHAVAGVRALNAGLHVYCEKPLGHTVAEARAMRLAAEKAKVATQMGTQIHAEENYRRVVEAVRSGAIGNVSEVHVWCNRNSSQMPVPVADATVPDYLHWDLWLGPAAMRPFRNGYLPGNLTWNRYWDFGNGIIGDMGSHLIDLPYWALALEFPATCEAEAPTAHPEIYPSSMIVRWEHPRRGDGPYQQPCKVVWYDGGSKPKSVLGVDVSGYGIGALFVGDRGKLLADYSRKQIIPLDGTAEPAKTPKTIAPSAGHHKEWINACKTGSPTLCNFSYSGKLIEHNLLGVVAHRVGKKLDWDAANLKATNAPEAEQFIHKKYREGWGEGLAT